MVSLSIRNAARFGLLLASLALVPAASAQPAVGVLAAGAAVNGVVDNLRGSILEILRKLDQSVSSGTFLARMQLTNLLAEIDFHATGLLDKTIGQLDVEQQRFFNNAQNTISGIQEMGDRLTENVDQITQRVEFLAGTIPFTDLEPRLRSVTPRVIEAPSADQKVRISFDGSWLANGTPRLSLEGTECQLSGLAEPKAAFDCPAKPFAGEVGSGVRYVNGAFSAVQPQGWWKKVRNFFGATPDIKSYPVSIGIVGNTFGSVKASAIAVIQQPETNRRTARYDTGAQHCTWGSETTLNLSPAGPDWSIDVNTISLVLDSGERSELRNVTPKGFQVYAVGHNSGSCQRVMGAVVSHDARGWANGHVDWTETRSVPKPAPSALFEGPVSWGDSKVLPLPAAVQSYIVSVKLFNGKTRDYNAPTRDEFFTLERDDANRSLKLSPRSLADAFK